MTRRALTGATLAVIASIAVTVVEGTPRHLPGVALGSTVLIHAERALTLLAVTVAAASILLKPLAAGCRSSYARAVCATKPKPPTTQLPQSPIYRSSSMTSWRSSMPSPSDSTALTNVPNL